MHILSSNPCDKSASEPKTHIWKLCSPAMAQPTARHEGDPGGEERLAVSQAPCLPAASVQPLSMPAHLARTGADHQKTQRRWQDGGDPRWSRGLTFPHQPPTSVHPPPTCTPNPPLTQKLTGFKKSDLDVPLFLLIFHPSPDCCSRVSTSWQWGARLSWLFTPPRNL